MSTKKNTKMVNTITSQTTRNTKTKLMMLNTKRSQLMTKKRRRARRKKGHTTVKRNSMPKQTSEGKNNTDEVKENYIVRLPFSRS